MNIKAAVFDMDGTLADFLTAIETAVKIGLPTVGIYDQYNHGQEQIQKLVKIYVGPGESLADIPGRML